MNKLKSITIVLFLVIFNNTKKTITNAATKDQQIIFPSDLLETNAINKFSWELFSKSETNSLSNFILCPLAVQYQLLLLEFGAIGESKKQLRNVTGGDDISLMQIYQLMNSQNRLAESKVLSANGIFMNDKKKLNVTYQLMIEKSGGEIYNVDFNLKSMETKNSINQWISLNTNGTIQEFLKNDIDLSTIEILLASALYFHGQWQHNFNSTTFRGQFLVNSDKVFMAEYMEMIQNFNFERIKFNDGMGMELIELPYKGNDYSMILLVPNSKTPLDIAIKLITIEGFDTIMKRNNERNSIRIRLVMPKFQITSQFSLVNTLKKMGLTNVFNKMSSLPYLTEKSEPLSISDILQQATLKVDEKGTIASAATTSFIIPLSADNKHEIIINRPFISIIFDRKNQCPLFLSKIMQPTAS